MKAAKPLFATLSNSKALQLFSNPFLYFTRQQHIDQLRD